MEEHDKLYFGPGGRGPVPKDLADLARLLPEMSEAVLRGIAGNLAAMAPLEPDGLALMAALEDEIALREGRR